MRGFCLILMSVMFALHAHAQTPVSFLEAVDMMMTNNRSIEGARYRVDAMEFERRAARGLRSPSLSLKGAYAFLQRDVDIDLGGAKGVVSESVKTLIDNGVSGGVIAPEVATLLFDGLSPMLSADWRYTLQKRMVGVVGLQLSMPIYAGGRINAAIKAADRRVGIESSNFDATANSLYSTLVERYYGIILLRGVVDVRRDVVAATEQHLSDAIAMEEAGVIAHSDVLYVEYRLSEAEQELATALDDLAIAERALCVVVGEDCMVASDEKLFVCNSLYSIDYYINTSLELNPVLSRAMVEHELADVGVKVARAELLPEVVAMGAAALCNYQLSDMIPRWSVGIGLNFNIFDGLRKERRLKAARMVERGVGALVENGREELVLLVEKEFNSVEKSLRKYATSFTSLHLASSLAESAQNGFEAGVTSATTLMDANVELAAARIDRLDAAYDYCCSLARLLEAAGISDTFASYRELGEMVTLK